MNLHALFTSFFCNIEKITSMLLRTILKTLFCIVTDDGSVGSVKGRRINGRKFESTCDEHELSGQGKTLRKNHNMLVGLC